ncbi:MAG: M3 family metallopeptidase, partial [Filifactor alocis]|nr:M3 family metallopeptidase [Filifactor alocis]
MLLINYLLKESKSNEEKIYLLNYFADMFKSTIFRQTMFAEFEKITHEKVDRGEALTAEELKKSYYELNKLYFGEKVAVDEQIALEWARIPHFYSDFYVYKYATGLSAAVLLSEKILQKEEGALENYLNFLKNGSREFPIEQLKRAGADMAKKESVQRALDVFKQKVDELEELL